MLDCRTALIGANRKLRPIHPRMAVILVPDSHQTWLDARQNRAKGGFSVRRPIPDEPMAFFRVPSRINSPRNDDPDGVEPISKTGS